MSIGLTVAPADSRAGTASRTSRSVSGSAPSKNTEVGTPTTSPLTLPNVGLIPTVPQSDDGMRIEPPVSEPVPPRHMPAASAAPVPPLDPPGIRAPSQGFEVGGVQTP